MRIDLSGRIGAGTCNRCGAEVVWVKSRAGKSVPINGDRLLISNIAKGGWIDPELNVCHFKTCRDTPAEASEEEHAHG